MKELVAAYPEEYVSIVSVGKTTIGSQFFTAWTRLLKPTTPIHPNQLKELETIRSELKSGRKIIKETRLVNP